MSGVLKIKIDSLALDSLMNLKSLLFFLKASVKNFQRLLRGKPQKYILFVTAVEGNTEKRIPIYLLPRNVQLRIRNSAQGKNIVRINLPQNNTARPFNANINFESGSGSVVDFGANIHGNYNLSLYGPNCRFIIGSENHIAQVSAVLIGNTMRIGNHCTFAGGIQVWGDGHAVIDNTTGKVQNLPSGEISVGNHVWIGAESVLTKNAGIPDDTIVGIRSIVTKKFTEKHTVIAGSPAKVVKKGISWDIRLPAECAELESKGVKLNDNPWNE